MRIDALGTRMKEYEAEYKQCLPRDGYVVVRLDGRAFHSYTRGMNKPFDTDLMNAMDTTSKALAEEISGCRLAYTQSDEISLILADFDGGENRQAWFAGNLQKIVSLSAALASVVFNEQMKNVGRPLFDSRAFVLPSLDEVGEYLRWRQRDSITNSISIIAQSLYSHKELLNKNGGLMKEMIQARGRSWDDYPLGARQGRVVIKIDREEPVFFYHKAERRYQNIMVNRRPWNVQDAPMLTDEWIAQNVPDNASQDDNRLQAVPA